MAFKIYDLYGGSDSEDNPIGYYGDMDIYEGLIASGKEALSGTTADEITFWNVEEGLGAGFVEESEYDEAEPENFMVDGVRYYFPRKESFGVTWLGPDLRVSRYGSSLVWHAKYSLEELWADL